MSNHYTSLLLAFAMVMTVAAQSDAMHGMQGDTACTTKVTCGFGFIVPGISWVDIDNFNDFIATQGISSFKAMTPTLSIGGHKEKRRLIMESGLTLRYWRDNVNSNLRTSLFAGDMVWNNGINVLPAALPLTAFPYFGLGVGLAAVHLRNDEKTFSQLLASSEPDATLWQASFLLNVGGGADVFLIKKGSTRGMALGIRAGYLFDPFSRKRDRKWRSGRTDIVDVPILRQNSPYLRLVIGGVRAQK